MLSFSLGRGKVSCSKELTTRLLALVDEQAERFGVSGSGELVADRFASLTRRVAEFSGRRVVVLVDEYDKPILDNIENTQAAEELRDGLKDFYSVLKESDAHIRFCFITGVSRFSRVRVP